MFPFHHPLSWVGQLCHFPTLLQVSPTEQLLLNMLIPTATILKQNRWHLENSNMAYLVPKLTPSSLH